MIILPRGLVSVLFPTSDEADDLTDLVQIRLCSRLEIQGEILQLLENNRLYRRPN